MPRMMWPGEKSMHLIQLTLIPSQSDVLFTCKAVIPSRRIRKQTSPHACCTSELKFNFPAQSARANELVRIWPCCLGLKFRLSIGFTFCELDCKRRPAGTAFFISRWLLAICQTQGHWPDTFYAYANSNDVSSKFTTFMSPCFMFKFTCMYVYLGVSDVLLCNHSKSFSFLLLSKQPFLII